MKKFAVALVAILSVATAYAQEQSQAQSQSQSQAQQAVAQAAAASAAQGIGTGGAANNDGVKVATNTTNTTKTKNQAYYLQSQAPSVNPATIVPGPGNRVVGSCGRLKEWVSVPVTYSRNGKKTFHLAGQNTALLQPVTEESDMFTKNPGSFYVFPDGSVFMKVSAPDGSVQLYGHMADSLVMSSGLASSSSWSIGGMASGGGGSVGGGASQSLSGAQVVNQDLTLCSFMTLSPAKPVAPVAKTTPQMDPEVVRLRKELAETNEKIDRMFKRSISK